MKENKHNGTMAALCLSVGLEPILDHRGHHRGGGWAGTSKCQRCGKTFYNGCSAAGGRNPKYCSDAHKQAAYRDRKKALRNAGSNAI